MNGICLLVQPIHEAGKALLEEAGIEVRQATASDMQTVAREIGYASAVITRNAGLNAEAMAAAPALRVIGNHGIGTDPVDLDRATDLGIVVVNTPFANVQSVAEHAIGLMLACARRTCEADRAVREGHFDFRYGGGFRELHGRRLGIVGFGAIGRRTAAIAKAAFDMDVIVHSPRAPREEIEKAGLTVESDLDALFASADVISLHTPLREANRRMVDARRLALTRPGAILVNTARGGLIDDGALIEALEAGRLGAAALDVFATEPLPADHPLTTAPRLILAPHLGGATEECLERTALETARQVLQVLRDEEPPHVVNNGVWPRRRR